MIIIIKILTKIVTEIITIQILQSYNSPYSESARRHQVRYRCHKLTASGHQNT